MKKNNYILIASSFIVFFALFIIGIMYLKDAGIGQSNYSFTVIFDNVQGLNDGDHVNMLGKRIGSVTKTKILKQRVAVELSIYDNFAFRIPIDSYIEVKSEGLLGSKYISIAPGKNGEKSIQPGDTVEGIREYDLSEITPGIVPMTQDLAAFARQLRSVLGDEQKESIKEIIASIESLSSNFDNLIVQQTFEPRISLVNEKLLFHVVDSYLNNDDDKTLKCQIPSYWSSYPRTEFEAKEHFFKNEKIESKQINNEKY